MSSCKNNTYKYSNCWGPVKGWHHSRSHGGHMWLGEGVGVWSSLGMLLSKPPSTHMGAYSSPESYQGYVSVCVWVTALLLPQMPSTVAPLLPFTHFLRLTLNNYFYESGLYFLNKHRASCLNRSIRYEALTNCVGKGTKEKGIQSAAAAEKKLQVCGRQQPLRCLATLPSLSHDVWKLVLSFVSV